MIVHYWNTLRYLKFSQIVVRVGRKFRRVKIDLSPADVPRRHSGVWIEPAKRTQRITGEQSFCFLNKSNDLVSVDDWNNRDWSKLWLYNLHYFDDLTAIDANQRVSWHQALICRWINENPSGEGNGWEPYPSSLRIVNWIKWVLTGNVLEESWEHSLTVQVRYLSSNLETHLLGNHLFANAKALLFAGLFFEGAEAEHWYQIGLKIVERELPEQVLSDGGNFELSTMYHAIFLEDLLDLVNVHRVYGKKLPSGIEERILAMFNWLEVMCHPDGEISFFNDAAFGITPSIKEIQDYGARLSMLSSLMGESDKWEHQNSLVDLQESGYSRVVVGDAVALIDRAAIGPDYLPGHAHADTLSFELSLFGQRVVVNSGTSVYGASLERQRQRGTAAHATVVIDGEDSSEVWGGFRVARRARILNRKQSERDGVVKLSACHDGYKRLSGKPVHCREWLFEKGILIIHDKIGGKGIHKIMSVLPLHPDIKVVHTAENRIVLDVEGHEVMVAVEGEGILEVVKGTYHPEFGLSVKNRKLVFRNSTTLPMEIMTRISW